MQTHIQNELDVVLRITNVISHESIKYQWNSKNHSSDFFTSLAVFASVTLFSSASSFLIIFS